MFSFWNLCSSPLNIRHVATNTSQGNPSHKSSAWNPFGPLNDAANEFKEKGVESLSNFDAIGKTIQELVTKAMLIFQYPTTWIFTLGGIGLFLSFYPNAKMMILDFVGWIPRTVAGSKLLWSNAGDNYISRSELERQVECAFTCTPDDNYFIVYGNKGAGKTELVTRTAIYAKNKRASKEKDEDSHHAEDSSRYGVVRVEITPGQVYDDILRTLLSKLYVDIAMHADDLVGQMKKVHNRFGIYPTIIFDIERGKVEESKTANVNAVRALAKRLAVVCRCILVLSEANSVLDVGDDLSRESFIFVGELSRDETRSFLLKRNCKITEDDFNYVFENIGSKPSDLLALAKKISSGMSVQEFVDGILKDATLALAAFPLKTILQALKDHPEGVSPLYFNNQEEKGIDLTNPAKVGQVMKEEYNVIIFRMELQRYELLSTAHKRALESYNPINHIPIPS